MSATEKDDGNEGEEKKLKLYSTGWVTKTAYIKTVEDYEKTQKVKDEENTTWWKSIGAEINSSGAVVNAPAYFHIHEGIAGQVRGRLSTHDYRLWDDFDDLRLPDLEVNDVAATWEEMAGILDATFNRILAMHGLDTTIEIVSPVEQ